MSVLSKVTTVTSPIGLSSTLRLTLATGQASEHVQPLENQGNGSLSNCEPATVSATIRKVPELEGSSVLDRTESC